MTKRSDDKTKTKTSITPKPAPGKSGKGELSDQDLDQVSGGEEAPKELSRHRPR